jgi:4-amino-4-deoxy-L-arabinose transferase-like glycosyltransferase
LLAADVFPFNSDEAVVALMARHILAGDRPAFFYGQAYMGSLDAGLVALGFALFGQHVIVIRVIQALLYAGTVATTVALAARLLGTKAAGVMAGLLVAIPTVNVTLYTTASLGGYGEALLIGNLLLLLGLKIADSPRVRWPYLVWGLLAGLGFWGFALVLVYIVPGAVFLLAAAFRRQDWRDGSIRVGILAVAAAIGATPWLVWALRNGLGPLVSELAGSAIAGASPARPLLALGSHLSNLLLFGTTAIWGLRPPWEIRWLALPLVPVALGFWLSVTVCAVPSLRRHDAGQAGRRMLAGVAVTLLAAFVLTPFGADPSGRYFLPLAVPMALFAADLLLAVQRRGAGRWACVLIAGILAFNLWGTVQSAVRNPPGLTTQFDAATRVDHRFDSALIAFLEQNGERRGYTNYWVAYPLAFLSGEDLVFVPRLPYHPDFRYTARDDRYPPYDDLVTASDRVAYITANHPALNERLRQGLAAAGASFMEVSIGDYHVFYRLSIPLRPEDIVPLPGAAAP